MFIIFLAIWCAIILFSYLRKKSLIFEPVFWFGMGWLLVTGLYFTSGFEYANAVKWPVLVYFWLYFLVFALGFRTGKVLKFVFHSVSYSSLEKRTNRNKRIRISRRGYRIYMLGLVLGFIMYILDFLMNNRLFAVGLHTGAQLSKIGVIGSIITTLGLVLWLQECAYAIINDKKIGLYGVVSACIYIMPGLLTSGRQCMIILLVSTFTVVTHGLYVNRRYKYKKIIIGAVIVLAVLLLLFCTIVAIFREDISDKEALFEYMFKCDISESTRTTLEKCGIFKMLILEIIAYYSHELPMFQLLMDKWGGEIFLGSSQFQLISQNLPESSFFHYSNVWDHIQCIWDANGSYSHVWRTMAGSCMIDFGTIGGLVFMFICGVLAGQIYKKARQRMDAYDVVMLSILNAGAIFSMQFSPFAEGFWYFPIIWLMILPFINRFLSNR